MTERRANQPLSKQTRLRFAGFVVAAAGLILGAVALEQSLAPLWGSQAAGPSFDWVLVEGIACAALLGLGFSLLVLGSDQFEDLEDWTLPIPETTSESKK